MVAVAGFPDLHPGRFGPVGAAFLADRIWRQLVGPAIGSGMALWRLDLPRHRLKIDKAVRRLAVLDSGADSEDPSGAPAAAGIEGLIAAYGLGSIGGGNYLREVQAVEEVNDPGETTLRPGDLCPLVHSGSRGRGAQIFEGPDDSWKQGYAPDSAAADRDLALHDAAMVWTRLNCALIATLAAEALSWEAKLICDTVHN